jgi:hypothetical protein
LQPATLDERVVIDQPLPTKPSWSPIQEIDDEKTISIYGSEATLEDILDQDIFDGGIYPLCHFQSVYNTDL